VDKMESNPISDIVLDAIRILILIYKFSDKKKDMLSIDKIILYDYYLKFPNTMIDSESIGIDLLYNFEEYYSFYHWKPDVGNYRMIIQYLLGKGAIIREMKKKRYFYCISKEGENVLNNLKSRYKKLLEIVADYIKENVANKKDSEVEQEIELKTGLIKRYEGE